MIKWLIECQQHIYYFFVFNTFSLASFGQNASKTTDLNIAKHEGEKLVEQYCTRCHRTNLIKQSSGYNASQWRDLIATMIDFSPKPNIEQQITNYLADTFPPNDLRSPTIIPGHKKITFKQWDI